MVPYVVVGGHLSVAHWVFGWLQRELSSSYPHELCAWYHQGREAEMPHGPWLVPQLTWLGWLYNDQPVCVDRWDGSALLLDLRPSREWLSNLQPEVQEQLSVQAFP